MICAGHKEINFIQTSNFFLSVRYIVHKKELKKNKDLHLRYTKIHGFISYQYIYFLLSKAFFQH